MSSSSNLGRGRRLRLPFGAALLPALLLLLCVLAPAPAAAVDTTASLGSLCAQSGGTSGAGGDHFQCCWPGWGCMHCYVDNNGEIPEGTCWVDCDTQACRDANGHRGLPPKSTGTVVLPGNIIPPPRTKKPKLQTVPGTDNVQ